MKNMNRAGIVAGASVLLFSGCVSTSFRASQDVDTRNLLAVSPGAVRVLDAPPPSGSFQQLGEIEAYLSGFPSDEAVLRKAREKAASIGADAIVLKSAMQVSRVLGDLPSSNQVVSVTFTAIRLLPEGSSQRHP